MSCLEGRESLTSTRSKTKSFDECYKSYCKSKNISPMRIIKNTEYVLDFCVDKIKFSQWEPIVISIGEDITLECLSIRCRSLSKVILENVDSEMKAKTITKSPVVLTRYVLWKLIDAVSQCISQTPSLTILQIEGVPLPEPYIDLLVEALNSNTSLKHIGLNGCQIGDHGCQKICNVLRNVNNVLVLNLSGCGLTSKGVSFVADMINFIKIMRYSENWQYTLRYQSPDLDAMNGLRRITLSDNPDVGDNGLITMLNVLIDDLWIKAVDFQQCGITDNVVKDCINFFENNTCLQILDLRHNANMSMKAYNITMAELRKNECASAKYSAWSLLANHPVFRNNQKICPQKTMFARDRPNRLHVGTGSIAKFDSGEPQTESVQVHHLKEQLKNEVTLRRKLEELNVKLLHQVKELKSSQIANWKARVQDTNKADEKSESTENPILGKKKREIITINLGEDSEQENLNSDSDVVNNCPTHSTASPDTVGVKKTKHHINLRECSGANLLETFLHQRRSDGSESQNGRADGYTSEASSDSSESTLCYTSGSSKSIVRKTDR